MLRYGLYQKEEIETLVKNGLYTILRGDTHRIKEKNPVF